MADYSYVTNAHPGYIDGLYQQYQQNPTSVDFGWQKFFEGFDYAASANGSAPSETISQSLSSKELNVLAIIEGFRHRGHLLATTTPIMDRRDRKPALDIADYGLTEADMDAKFAAGNEIGIGVASLRDIIERLHEVYAGNIGFEYAYIQDREERTWLKDKIEAFHAKDFGHSLDKKRRILEKLNGAVVFEKFLHTKYLGEKRFSLEGGETAIPALDAIIGKASAEGVEEVVIGMAHRGRLNVLANIMGKTYEHLFNEFEETAIPNLTMGDGDVKYHLGYSSQVKSPHGKTVNLKLAPNPSHLEAVNTVVLGFTRAKADILYKSDYKKVLPILIHGDAAIAGQGIMFETVQMSQLEGYYTGGTLHFVINNQIGFTTDYDDARTSTYCTGAAAVVQAPVFHVNGDNPDAVVFAVELAAEFRQKFHKDIFIDMVCYRRHGHNEGDEPKFTQPKMYAAISKHPNPRDMYSKKLMDSGELEAELAKKLEDEFWGELQERLDLVKQKPLPYHYQEPEKAWQALKSKTEVADFIESPDTSVNKKTLEKITKHILTLPKDFNALRQVDRLVKGKQKLIAANSYDWALAELMAYGSILLEGKDIRMSGQDVKRGTFAHRHAVLFDTETKEQHNRLSGMSKTQGTYRIFNSLLSEFGVLGFEFGYSLASPDPLVIWEAQFGDFYNGAQSMVDQFVSSSESKWQRNSGLVMLLPHGYEGQGPEHSSARLERWLQLCAEFNMTVANPSTPANFFHLIRRQLARPFRKPLVVMSPKSLLRYPACVSPMEDFTSGGFREIIEDEAAGKNKTSVGKVKTVLCCTGKIYYDLIKRKEETKRDDVAICRLEQLYPFPKTQVDELLRKYSTAKFAWVQEEPSNMGAWQYILAFYRKYDLHLISRKSSASPATGYKSVHKIEQKEIVDRAFAFGK